MVCRVMGEQNEPKEKGEWERGRGEREGKGTGITFCVSSSESKVIYQQSFSANSHVQKLGQRGLEKRPLICCTHTHTHTHTQTIHRGGNHQLESSTSLPNSYMYIPPEAAHFS